MCFSKIPIHSIKGQNIKYSSISVEGFKPCILLGYIDEMVSLEFLSLNSFILQINLIFFFSDRHSMQRRIIRQGPYVKVCVCDTLAIPRPSTQTAV